MPIDHMQGMQACHDEVEDQKQLHLGGMWSAVCKPDPGHQVSLILVRILRALDAQKHRSR